MNLQLVNVLSVQQQQTHRLELEQVREKQPTENWAVLGSTGYWAVLGTGQSYAHPDLA